MYSGTPDSRLPTEVRERRYVIEGKGRMLAIAPLAMGVVGLWAIADQPRALLAGGPVLLLFIYGAVVLMTCYHEVQIDARGFRVRSGPLPTGAHAEAHDVSAVVQLFPRYLREGVARGVYEDRYYACVELTNGRWMNVRGRYADWASASASCAKLASLWGLAEIGAGRQGFPAAGAWHRLRALLVWGGAFISALAWAIFVEVRR